MAAMVLLSARLTAQEFSITGIVRDGKSNQALTGASVQVEGLSKGTMTDEFGRFRLEKLKAGEYSVNISFIGCQSKTEKVVLSANADLEITLEQSTDLTDEVVVYGTRANDKTPTTFTNVSGQSLQKQNFGQDMPMLLNWTPSLVTTSDAGAGVGYTGLRIRGSDATRINVTINGIPYNDSESQGTYWVDIPDVAASTQSVQVQRGVGTSTNGAGAFGGSVNVQTNSLRPDAYAELMTAAGSFNTQRYALKAGTGLINNKWAFDGRVSKITSDGYIDRATSDLSSYYLSGGYYGKKTMIKAITFGGHEKTYQAWNGNDGETMKTNRTFNSAGALYDENYNVTGYYDNEVDDYRQDHYQLHLTQKINSYWNANLSFHYTYGRGYYELYNQNQSFASLGLEDIVLKDTTITSGDFIVRKWLDNKFYGTTFSFNYDKDKTNLTIGGAFNQYGHAKHYGEIIWAQYSSNSQIRQHYYDGESQKNDFNMFAKWNYELTPSLNAFADMQYRYVGYKASGIEDALNPYDINETFNFLNPKAGLSYSLSLNDVLYGSYAIANREPNRSDYLGSDVKPKSEHLENLEAGWRRKSERYAFELNYYLMNYRNQLVLTGKLDNVGNPIRENVGKSYRSGVELSGTAKLTDKLTWNANATWSVNKNVDYVTDPSNVSETKNTTIVLSPGWIAGSQLTYNVFGNFAATLLTKYVGKQYLDNTQTETLILEDYFVNDVRFNYSLSPKGMKALDLSLLVNNIFGVKYSSNGATYGDGVGYYFPQAGTNFMGMVTMKF
ncbi:MAG TPA: TonB-dependent receptor [Cyclobacteriaceae bacterium]|nr:TonB-dependent receptor [Cyclobacteriaceae bacterium]